MITTTALLNLFERTLMEWLNEPPRWRENGELIEVTAGPRTDFWRKTHDGGIRDNGHFYHRSVNGDFRAGVKVSGRYAGQYDQAGLMVRLDKTCWLKCGVELLNGVQQASAVVTRNWSDWSVVPLANPPAIWLDVVRSGATLEVSYSLDGQATTMIRQAHLTEVARLDVGIMIASPTGPGFSATFEGFSVTDV